MPPYSDKQFNYILEVLIYYKKCCPQKDVFLSEKSLKNAIDYFQKSGIFEKDFKFNN